MKNPLAHATAYAGEIAGVALLWYLLFKLNIWLFLDLEYRENVNWIFLPAAIRVLAVLLFGWRAAAGLFIGALLTSQPNTIGPLHMVFVATISALSPLFAVSWVSRILKLTPDLNGLNFEQLSALSFAGAALSALLHSLYFSYQAGALNVLWGVFPMFAGDLVGTMLVLYAVHFGMRIFIRTKSHGRL